MRYLRVSDGTFRDDYPHAFGTDGMRDLATFLDRAGGSRPLREALDGSPGVFLRHDIDHNIDHAVEFGRWEASRGYRASFYVLHTSWYWADEPMLRTGIDALLNLGHEVGIHQDAVAEAWRDGFRSPLDGSVLPISDCHRAAEIFAAAVDRLRGFGVDVVGSATHGSALWRSDSVTNSFLWAAGWRPEDFGLAYEAYFLHRFVRYISDNRGAWSAPLVDPGAGQVHVLTHPCHHDILAMKAAA